MNAGRSGWPGLIHPQIRAGYADQASSSRVARPRSPSMAILCPLLMRCVASPHPQHRGNAVFAGNDRTVGENAADVRHEPDRVGKQLRPCRCRQRADQDRIRFHLIEVVGSHDDAGDSSHHSGRHRKTPQDALFAVVVSERSVRAFVVFQWRNRRRWSHAEPQCPQVPLRDRLVFEFRPRSVIDGRLQLGAGEVEHVIRAARPTDVHQAPPQFQRPGAED